VINKKLVLYGSLVLIPVVLVLGFAWLYRAPSQEQVNLGSSSVSSRTATSTSSSIVTSKSSSISSSSSQSSVTVTEAPPPIVSDEAPNIQTSIATSSSAQSSAVSSSSSSSAPASAAPFTGIVVPLYAYPGDLAYTNLITTKQLHPTVPIIAIINTQGSDIQNNATIRALFVTEASRLHNVGITILGYVDTAYSARPLTEVQNSSCGVGDCTLPGVTTYTANGIHIDGVFADQVCAGYTYGACTPSSVAYYQSVTNYVHATANLELIMTNQGTAIIDSSYYSLADLALTYENDAALYNTSLYAANNPYATNDTVLLYNSGSVLNLATVQSLKNRVKYLYLTPDTLPNPWDTLPTFIGQLAQLLE
jgi:Spherulation-specific family 4